MADYYLVDPNDQLTWSHDWSDFLAVGDSIASRQWTIDPDASPTLLASATSATVTAGPLDAGNVYRLSEKIATANGEIAERAIVIRCEER